MALTEIPVPESDQRQSIRMLCGNCSVAQVVRVSSTQGNWLTHSIPQKYSEGLHAVGGNTYYSTLINVKWKILCVQIL